MTTSFFYGNNVNLIALVTPGATIFQNELHASLVKVNFGDKIVNMGGGADVFLGGQTLAGDTIFANGGNDRDLDKLYAFAKPFYGVPFENNPAHHEGLYYWALDAFGETRTNSYSLKGHTLTATALKAITEYHGPGADGHYMWVSDFNRKVQTIRTDGELTDVIRFTEDATKKIGDHYETLIKDVYVRTEHAPDAFPGDPIGVRISFTAHDKAGYTTPLGFVDKQLFTNDDFLWVKTAHGTKAEKIAAIETVLENAYDHPQGGADGKGWLIDLS